MRFRVSRFALIDTSTFGGWLKKKRLEMGLEQKELAEILGVSDGSVYNWENGRSRPTAKGLKQLNEVISFIDTNV